MNQEEELVLKVHAMVNYYYDWSKLRKGAKLSRGSDSEMVTLWIKGPSRVKASGGQCGMHETEIIERLQLLVKI